MIESSKNSTENYPRKCFWTQEKEPWVKFNPGLSANRPSNNWAQDFTTLRGRSARKRGGLFLSPRATWSSSLAVSSALLTYNLNLLFYVFGILAFSESREPHFLKFTLAQAASFSGKCTFDQLLFQANVNRFILCKRVSGTQISLYPSDTVTKYYLGNSGEKQDSYLKLLGVTRN